MTTPAGRRAATGKETREHRPAIQFQEWRSVFEKVPDQLALPGDRGPSGKPCVGLVGGLIPFTAGSIGCW